MNNWIYGFHSIESYLEQDATNIEIAYIDDTRKDKRIKELIAKIQSKQVVLKYIQYENLSKLCGNNQHQGVIAKVTTITRKIHSFDEFIDHINQQENPIVLILDGITDPYNLGAIIRTADCFGVAGIILPQNNSANINNATVVKASSGAIQHIPIILVNNLNRAINTLKEYDFWIAGTSLTKDSISLPNFKCNNKIVWVMGSEGTGLRRLVAENCDYLVNIPMYGGTQSLNVSVATGIILAHTRFMPLK